MFKKILILLAVAFVISAVVPTIQVQAATGCTLGNSQSWSGTPTIRSNNTNIRTQSNTTSGIVGIVHRGARVRITHRCGSGNIIWLRGTVQSGTGSNGNANRTGWIRSDMFEGFFR